jgi:hypothetical protein
LIPRPILPAIAPLLEQIVGRKPSTGDTPSYTKKQAVTDRGLLFIWHSSAVAFLPACVTFSISINKICDF